MSGKKICEGFSCKIWSTCIFAPDCNRDCLYVVDLCRACALEHGCRSKKTGYYKEGKTYYKEFRK